MLDIHFLSKEFNKGTPDAHLALNQFSMKVTDGEFVTLLGGNGSGKSTLFNLIAGSIFPDSGTIRLEDKDITFLPEHRRALLIGRVFQNPLTGTAPNMTIEENLAISYMRGTGRSLLHRTTKQDRTFFREQLYALGLGLENRMNTRIGLLSGGQRQAITLLMATMVKPKLLLLDEHTAALDPQSAVRVTELTERIIAEGKITTIMVTHSIGTALHTGSRLMLLDGGRIAMDIQGEARQKITRQELLDSYAH